MIAFYIFLRFGNLGGFQILLERFQSGKNLTVSVIYALIRPFGLCYEYLTVHTIVKYLMPIIVSWYSSLFSMFEMNNWDCRLLVLMGRDFVSALRLWLIVLSLDESDCDRLSEWDRLGLTPNLTTRDFWRSRRLAMKWEFCLFISVGLQEFFYMP
jgi:hypothetical protein